VSSRFANSAITDFLELIGVSAATPAVGRLRLFAQRIAGRSSLTVRDENGVDNITGLHIGYHKYALWSATGNSATAPTPIGINAFTTLVAGSVRTVTATNAVTRRRRLGYVSAATANAMAGHYSNVAQYLVGNGTEGGFHYVCKFNVSDAAAVAGARMFVGMRAAVAAPTNIEPSAQVNFFGVAKLATSTNLHIVYGGSAAQAVIDLGVNFPAADSAAAYTVTFYNAKASNNTIGYHVTREGTAFTATGTLAGAAGVAIPASTILLAHTAWRTNNATLLAVGIDISTVYIGDV
jgi:hypothetical protein